MRNEGELKTAAVLCTFGRKVRRMPQSHCPYDLLVDGLKVEIKTANPTKKNGRVVWQFSIHRHKILDESNVDFYIFVFQNVPGSNNSIYAKFPSPLGKKMIQFSFRKLLEGAIADQVKDFRKLNLRRKNITS